MYELVVIWMDGSEREIHKYDSEEEAEKAADNMEMSFGRQVWCGVRRKVN